VYLTDDQLSDAFKNKEIDGAVVFGSTFTSDLATKKNASLRVVAEGTDQAKGAAISSALTAAAAKATAQQQTLSTQAQQGPAASGQQVAGSPIKVVPERYYGSGLGAKEFALASIIGLISFVLPCLLAMVAVFGRKNTDSQDSKAPGPLGRVIGYLCVFSLLGIVQVLTVVAYAIWYINATFVGEAYAVAFVQILIAVAGVAVGILLASLAGNFVGAFTLFLPTTVLQMLFGGLMVPIAKFPEYVRYFSYALPYTYASDAVKNIVLRGFTLRDVWTDGLALATIAIVAALLTTLALVRKTKAEAKTAPVARAE
ncbi:MAG TPA: ABC transporter permease, partial [Methanocella sp.]|nr:ABC transporter permease [Methanocella sp.]